MGTIFPQKMVTYLRCQHTFRANSALANLDTIYNSYYDYITLFLLNSIYDPLLIAGQVVQPQFYDILAARYNRYLVQNVKWNLYVVSNDSANDYKIANWIPTAGSTTIASWDQLELQNSCQLRYVRAQGNNGDRCALKGFTKPDDYMALVDYSNKFAATNNSPNTKIYMYLYAMNMTSSTTDCDLIVTIRMVQKVVLGLVDEVPDST